MNFDTALNNAIDHADWNIDVSYNQGDTIGRDISKTRGMTVKVNVRRPDVESTWDKWDEAKQKRAQETLTTYIANTLRRVSPSMTVFLGPDSWTPAA